MSESPAPIAPLRRVYSDAERADALAVLASNGGNVKRTARETGIPERTLASWRDRPMSGTVRAAGHVRSQLMAQTFERLIWRLARSVKGKVNAAQLPAVLNGMGTLFDRMQLLQAQNARDADTSAPAGLDLSRLTSEELRTFLELVERAGGAVAHPSDDDELPHLADGGPVVLAVSDCTPSGGEQMATPRGDPPDAFPWERSDHSGAEV